MNPSNPHERRSCCLAQRRTSIIAIIANPPDEVIRQILQSLRTIAVVGLSSDPSRPGYTVPAYMQRHGYRIMPVNPHLTEALEERAYENLRSISDPVEIVNIFRRPEHIPPLVEEAVEIGAQVVWMQLGIQHPEAAQRATEAGLTVVQDRCLRVEHQRLLLLA